MGRWRAYGAPRATSANSGTPTAPTKTTTDRPNGQQARAAMGGRAGRLVQPLALGRLSRGAVRVQAAQQRPAAGVEAQALGQRHEFVAGGFRLGFLPRRVTTRRLRTFGCKCHARHSYQPFQCATYPTGDCPGGPAVAGNAGATVSRPLSFLAWPAGMWPVPEFRPVFVIGPMRIVRTGGGLIQHLVVIEQATRGRPGPFGLAAWLLCCHPDEGYRIGRPADSGLVAAVW